MVISLTTTYRHDYVPPFTNRYRFVEKPEKQDEIKKTCDCSSFKIPSSKAKNVGLKQEWTGIAPMGKLIEPRIIPAIKTIETQKVHPCQQDQPNRFLKILETCYPDLHERLKGMPQDELQRRTDAERLRTTYQVDYCHMSEYPEGLYASMTENKKDSAGVLHLSDGCDNFREQVKTALAEKPADDCIPTYTPHKMAEKITFGNSASAKNGGDKGHWGVSISVTNKPVVTEYMDSISRTGCIIMRNKIHDHSKCAHGLNCSHRLDKSC